MKQKLVDDKCRERYFIFLIIIIIKNEEESLSYIYIAGTSIPSEYSASLVDILSNYDVSSVAVAGSTASDLYGQIESLGTGSGWILTDGGVQNSLAFGFGFEQTVSDVITAVNLGHDLGYQVALTDSYNTDYVDDSLMQDCNEFLATASGADVIIQISDIVNNNEGLLRDGVHPTDEGKVLLANRVAESLTPYLDGSYATSLADDGATGHQTADTSFFGGGSNDAFYSLFSQMISVMNGFTNSTATGDFASLLGGNQASYLAVVS